MFTKFCPHAMYCKAAVTSNALFGLAVADLFKPRVLRLFLLSPKGHKFMSNFNLPHKYLHSSQYARLPSMMVPAKKIMPLLAAMATFHVLLIVSCHGKCYKFDGYCNNTFGCPSNRKYCKARSRYNYCCEEPTELPPNDD